MRWWPATVEVVLIVVLVSIVVLVILLTMGPEIANTLGIHH